VGNPLFPPSARMDLAMLFIAGVLVFLPSLSPTSSLRALFLARCLPPQDNPFPRSAVVILLAIFFFELRSGGHGWAPSFPFFARGQFVFRLFLPRRFPKSREPPPFSFFSVFKLWLQIVFPNSFFFSLSPCLRWTGKKSYRTAREPLFSLEED